MQVDAPWQTWAIIPHSLVTRGLSSCKLNGLSAAIHLAAMQAISSTVTIWDALTSYSKALQGAHLIIWHLKKNNLNFFMGAIYPRIQNQILSTLVSLFQIH